MATTGFTFRPKSRYPDASYYTVLPKVPELLKGHGEEKAGQLKKPQKVTDKFGKINYQKRNTKFVAYVNKRTCRDPTLLLVLVNK